MQTEILRVIDIFPTDLPRPDSQNDIADLWGHYGPPQEVIDLTADILGMFVLELNDGTHLVWSGNNRLGYIAGRCGTEQKVKVNIRTENETRNGDVDYLVEDWREMQGLGIRDFNDWVEYSKIEVEGDWDYEHTPIRNFEYSPFN